MSAEAHLEVYRRFTGRLQTARFPAWALYTSALRTALKQRRALFILYLPALIATVILCFAVYLKFTVQGQLSDESRLEAVDFEQLMAHQLAAHAEQMFSVVNMILQFCKATGFFAVLAVAWFASGLFCDDRKAGAHQLYFARPITRLDYFLGKFLVAATFALLAMLVPQLLVCVMAAVSSPDWVFLREEWDVFLRVIAFSLTWTVVVSSLVLLASSLASRKSFALLGTFAFLMLSFPVAGQLSNVDEDLLVIALLVDLEVLSSSIFGQPSDDVEVAATAAWTAVTAFTLFAWAVIAWRLRRLEVVA
jgi:ABC-type transport system involved in multi-copper enzyme maturation permease subunit